MTDFDLSFEFFPPKTPASMTTLINETVPALCKAHPDFFSVTFGAGGSTRDGTLETVMHLQSLGLKVAPHLACMGLDREEIIFLLEKYQSLNIKHIVALRGDLPSGMGRSGEFKYADELVTFIREQTHDHFYIEVAAYPEVHPQASNALADILHLKRKMDAGANRAITQYFFNSDAYFYFRDACLKEGITIPIVPGIMPITHFGKLVRFSDMCGAEIPRYLRKRLESLDEDSSAVENFGEEVVYNLCERLISGGAPGLHFYTLNHAKASLGILQRLVK